LSNKSRKHQEGIFSAISAGFFLLLVGAIFVGTPNLFGAVVDFFQDFSIVHVPNTDLMFIGPDYPRLHMTVYQAALQFSIALAAFQVVMLALRFFLSSTWSKRSETFGNLVYWAIVAFLIQTYLVESTQWFVFWSAIIIAIGVSLIARAIFSGISQIGR
jgi:hypothetical protein